MVCRQSRCRRPSIGRPLRDRELQHRRGGAAGSRLPGRHRPSDSDGQELWSGCRCSARAGKHNVERTVRAPCIPTAESIRPIGGNRVNSRGFVCRRDFRRRQDAIHRARSCSRYAVVDRLRQRRGAVPAQSVRATGRNGGSSGDRCDLRRLVSAIAHRERHRRCLPGARSVSFVRTPGSARCCVGAVASSATGSRRTCGNANRNGAGHHWCRSRLVRSWTSIADCER